MTATGNNPEKLSDEQIAELKDSLIQEIRDEMAKLMTELTELTTE